MFQWQKAVHWNIFCSFTFYLALLICLPMKYRIEHADFLPCLLSCTDVPVVGSGCLGAGWVSQTWDTGGQKSLIVNCFRFWNICIYKDGTQTLTWHSLVFDRHSGVVSFWDIFDMSAFWLWFVTWNQVWKCSSITQSQKASDFGPWHWKCLPNVCVSHFA